MSHEYPEHVKLMKVVDKSQVIGEFLEWFEDTHDGVLPGLLTSDSGINQIIAQFFGIDYVKLMAEKDQMFAQLVEMNQEDDS